MFGKLLLNSKIDKAVLLISNELKRQIDDAADGYEDSEKLSFLYSHLVAGYFYKYINTRLFSLGITIKNLDYTGHVDLAVRRILELSVPSEYVNSIGAKIAPESLSYNVLESNEIEFTRGKDRGSYDAFLFCDNERAKPDWLTKILNGEYENSIRVSEEKFCDMSTDNCDTFQQNNLKEIIWQCHEGEKVIIGQKLATFKYESTTIELKSSFQGTVELVNKRAINEYQPNDVLIKYRCEEKSIITLDL